MLLAVWAVFFAALIPGLLPGFKGERQQICVSAARVARSVEIGRDAAADFRRKPGRGAMLGQADERDLRLEEPFAPADDRLVEHALTGVADLGVLHFEPKVVSFAGTFTHAGEA